MASCPISRAILGVENTFRRLFGSYPEGDAILKITDDGKAMQWIQSSPEWESVSHTLRVRVEGMVKTCKGFISVVNTSGIIPDKVESWQALVLGSLALCVRVLIFSRIPIQETTN